MSERFGNFADKFNGASLGARWTLFSGTTPPHVGGAIVATADFDMSAGAADPDPEHQIGSFIGKYVIQQLTVSPNYGSWLYVNSFPYSGLTAIGFDIYGGNIELFVQGDVEWTEVYDPDVHKAIRIREDDGTVYAEYWNGYEWTEVFSMETPSWMSSDVADSQGGYVNDTPEGGEAVTIYSYNLLDPAVDGVLDHWCPSSVTDPESSDPEDLGDFEESNTPTYTSQKNIVDVAYDPRTGVLMRTQGGFGAFGESPSTTQKFSFSTDCGRTWSEPVDFGEVIEGSYNDPPFNAFGIPDFFHTIVSVIPGALVGQWLAFDYCGGYYLSNDNGATWGPRILSGIAPSQSGPDTLYYGIVGVNGQFNTRHINPHHYLEVSQIGYSFMLENPFRVGIRRSLGLNGADGWETSLAPTDLVSGGTGWAPGNTPPILHGANGRWIAAVGWQETFGENDSTFEEEIVPSMRINTSPDLDPESWGEPFYPVSQAWVEDIYGTFKTGGSYGNKWLYFEFGAGRLKFIPQTGHPAGGRWWLMGMQDSIIYSDDNGVTWSNSLADHTGAEDAMHPILNWRASHALGYRYTPSKILDIVHDPFGSGRLISIGVTYDRAGISNRLAVYSCSVDGGNSWGPVGQLALRLSNITSEGIGSDHDSPAMVRHGFPCMAI